MKFYRCDVCGRIVEETKSGAGTLDCCGQPMRALEPGATDGAHEKHVPDVWIEGVNVVVRVGSVEHPSTPAHYIEWIAIETTSGTQRKTLDPGDLPKAEFTLAPSEKLVAAYEYCNLHGLWIRDLAE